MPLRRCAVLSLCAMMTLTLPAAAVAQAPVADPADVGTLAGIVHAWYDVINGPPGQPRQWRRDSTLYTASATFVALDERDGKPVATILTPEEFRRAVNANFVKYGFYETEVGSRIERFGNVASIRSVYETRRTPDGPVTQRGINYILAFWDGTRWWISGAVWDDEHGSTQLPKEWVGVHEETP